MRRFAVIIAAILLPLPLVAPAHGCERHRAYPCHASDALGILGAAILAGNAEDPPIPGTTWGLSPKWPYCSSADSGELPGTGAGAAGADNP